VVGWRWTERTLRLRIGVVLGGCDGGLVVEKYGETGQSCFRRVRCDQLGTS
jgi:hypothetical protein